MPSPTEADFVRAAGVRFEGNVRDAVTTSILSGATVTTQGETKVTNASSSFEIFNDGLKEGTFLVTVRHEGYVELQQKRDLHPWLNQCREFSSAAVGGAMMKRSCRAGGVRSKKRGVVRRSAR
jgi:hypothetical protein